MINVLNHHNIEFCMCVSFLIYCVYATVIIVGNYLCHPFFLWKHVGKYIVFIIRYQIPPNCNNSQIGETEKKRRKKLSLK